MNAAERSASELSADSLQSCATFLQAWREPRRARRPRPRPPPAPGARPRKSYLEQFRAALARAARPDQDAAPQPQSDSAEEECMSVAAEYGDTERASAGDAELRDSELWDSELWDRELWESECYNDMFYQSLLSAAAPPALPAPVAPAAPAADTTDPVSECEKSGSDAGEAVVRRRRGREARPAGDCGSERRLRGRSAGEPPPPPVCRLGGLGPDVEALRSGLERARSVQRYSQRVRIDNKLRGSRRAPPQPPPPPPHRPAQWCRQRAQQVTRETSQTQVGQQEHSSGYSSAAAAQGGLVRATACAESGALRVLEARHAALQRAVRDVCARRARV